MGGKGRTTVELSKVTRDKLKELGKKGEAYDEVIRRLTELVKGEMGWIRVADSQVRGDPGGR